MENKVSWTGTPRPNTPDWPTQNETGNCESCGRETTLRPDPIVYQMVCRPCWEGLMFDD